MLKSVLFATVVIGVLPTFAHADELLWKLGERHGVSLLKQEVWPGSNQYVACTEGKTAMQLMYSNYGDSAYGYSIKVGDSLAIDAKTYSLKSLDDCVAHFE